MSVTLDDLAAYLSSETRYLSPELLRKFNQRFECSPPLDITTFEQYISDHFSNLFLRQQLILSLLEDISDELFSAELFWLRQSEVPDRKIEPSVMDLLFDVCVKGQYDANRYQLILVVFGQEICDFQRAFQDFISQKHIDETNPSVMEDAFHDFLAAKPSHGAKTNQAELFEKWQTQGFPQCKRYKTFEPNEKQVLQLGKMLSKSAESTLKTHPSSQVLNQPEATKTEPGDTTARARALYKATSDKEMPRSTISETRNAILKDYIISTDLKVMATISLTDKDERLPALSTSIPSPTHLPTNRIKPPLKKVLPPLSIASPTPHKLSEPSKSSAASSASFQFSALATHAKGKVSTFCVMVAATFLEYYSKAESKLTELLDQNYNPLKNHTIR